MLSLAQIRQSRWWLQSDILFRLFGYEKEVNKCLSILHGFSNQAIRERRKEYLKEIPRKDHKRRLAFLDLLLEYSKEYNLSDEQIREEVDTFMFEGHDTTAAAINWSLYLLGLHPTKINEIQIGYIVIRGPP